MLSSLSASQLGFLLPVVLVTAEFLLRLLRDHAERKRHPLPPGPRNFLPFLGSAPSVDPKMPWKTFMAWAQKYKSDVIYARLFGQDVVILNTLSDSIQLLGKRSQIYSDRICMASTELYGLEFSIFFHHYGDHWKLCRRMIHRTFRPEALLTLRSAQLRKSRWMIKNMIEDPKSYASHISTFSAGISMAATCQHETSDRNDPVVVLAENFLRASLLGLTTWRATLLNVFPSLLHMPDWFPMSWIKREARESRSIGLELIDRLFQHAQDRVDSGEQTGGLAAEHIAHMEQLGEVRKAEYLTAIKQASFSAFLGGSESTTASIMTFTLAMVANPDVWKRAQAELDDVVGTDRLPELEDSDSLPYVNAIYREVLRWHPVIPLGVPHAATSSDVYKGYFIPKGTAIVSNVWAISHDETRYPQADKFIPERFLDSEGTLNDDDPAEFVFGFGRRICPGRHAANSTLWIAIATMLASLEFHRAKNENGEDVEFEAKFVNSFTHRPEVFPCRLVPRSHVTEEILEETIE